jgi:uncharacterized membrane protein YfcA
VARLPEGGGVTVAVAIGLGAVVAGAALVQQISGFGFALLSVPLMALLIDAKDAVVLAALFGLASSTLLVARAHHGVVWPVAWRMLASAAVGMPLGLVVLLAVDEGVLRLIIAAAVLIFVAVLLTGFTVRGRGRGVDVAAGFVSGVLNTSVSTNGPPLVLALQARGLGPAEFRGTISAVFVGSSLVGNLLLAAAGRWTAEVGRGLLIGAPALVIGWLIGHRLAGLVSPARFRRLVIALLLASAGSAILSVVAG